MRSITAGWSAFRFRHPMQFDHRAKGNIPCQGVAQVVVEDAASEVWILPTCWRRLVNQFWIDPAKPPWVPGSVLIISLE